MPEEISQVTPVTVEGQAAAIVQNVNVSPESGNEAEQVKKVVTDNPTATGIIALLVLGALGWLWWKNKKGK